MNAAIEVIHWSALLTGCVLAFRYFRAMGDVTQVLFNVTRDELLHAAQHEPRTLAIAAGCATVALASHISTGVGDGAWITGLLAATGVMIAFPWLWVHVGLRDQQSNARYFDINQASALLADDDSVLVVTAQGQSWAFPDREISRPHIAGIPGAAALVMTYCALSRLGVAVRLPQHRPPADLSVVGQHGNNLILKAQDQCLQQIYLGLDGPDDGRYRRMPVVRMSWPGFCKAYPEGQVFLNPMVRWRSNPLLRAFDEVIDRVFVAALHTHHVSDKLMFETLRHEDDRLPRKTLVWSVSIGDDAAAFTADYIYQQGVLNVEVGGVPIVLTYDEDHDCLAAFARPSRAPIKQLDFRGNSEAGKLPNVAAFYPGMYWFAWCNFFPHTTLNGEGVAAPLLGTTAKVATA